MINKRKKYIIAGLIVLQFLFLLVSTAVNEISLFTGKTIILKLDPIDPRSLLQGDYVILNYRISEIDPDQFKTQKGLLPSRVKVVLRKTPSGEYIFKAPYDSKKKLDKDDVVLNGRITGGRIAYGIESYFVPEGTGLEVERAANYAVIKVPASGNAMVVRLISHISEANQ